MALDIWIELALQISLLCCLGELLEKHLDFKWAHFVVWENCYKKFLDLKRIVREIFGFQAHFVVWEELTFWPPVDKSRSRTLNIDTWSLVSHLFLLISFLNIFKVDTILHQLTPSDNNWHLKLFQYLPLSTSPLTMFFLASVCSFHQRQKNADST